MQPYDSIEHPLKPLCDQWLRKIKDAEKVKEERFGRYAKEAAKFFDGPHDFMWKEEYAQSQQGGFLDKGRANALPMFQMTVNKPFEAVALIGPALYHQNPQIAVTPIHTPEIPPEMFGLDVNNIPEHAMMFQQIMARRQFQESQRDTHASIKEHYLNWLQVEADKKTQARRAITEAVVKGLSFLWTEMYSPRGSRMKYPKSYYVSCDDIVVDPDAVYWEDVQWIARKCVHPVNRVEEEYNLPKGSLKGHLESLNSQGNTYAVRKETQHRKKDGGSYDLICYWQVYSKNGFGDKLKTTDKISYKSKFDFSMFGDFCYLAVADNVPYPLTMPSWSLAEDPESLFMRSQWPIPFWTDGGWPFSRLYFYDKPNSVWPVGLFKPVIGELRFVNWCMSFLADKVAASATTYIAQAEAAGMKIQDQLQSGLAPYTVIEISDLLGRSVSDVVSFLDAPQFSIDIWRMVSEVLQMIDKRTGLTELVYGMSSKQVRSAKEAEVKDQNTSIRPDDMANSVEECLSDTAMKEMEAICWYGEPQDLMGPLGEDGARVFMEQIKTQDFDTVVRDFSYRVVAGSARKPNKNTRIANLNDFGQIALPTIQQFALQGVTQPWNAFMYEIAKAMDFDAKPFLLPEPQQEEPQGPSEEEVKAAAEARKLEHEEAKHLQELRQDEETHQQELEQAAEKYEVDIDFLRRRARMAGASSNGNGSKN